jgi:divalent metal cation (Fe/Co/Zn/Cd) transporter
LLTKITGNGIFDVIGTALIGLLLVAVAVTLAAETKSLLLGEAAAPATIAAVAAALTGTDGVERVIHMKTLHLGPEEIMVAAKIAVRPTESAAEVAALIDRAEVAIRGAEPMVTALYLEPDIYSETYRPAPRPERPGAPAH